MDHVFQVYSDIFPQKLERTRLDTVLVYTVKWVDIMICFDTFLLVKIWFNSLNYMKILIYFFNDKKNQ